MNESSFDLPVSGSLVLHETAHLLHGLRVAPDQAAFVQGERVTIFIAPSREDDQTFSLCFTCRPWGHQSVDWSRLVLWACVADSPRPLTYRIALNARGQHGLTGCEPVEYVLRALYLDEAKRLSAPPAPRTYSTEGVALYAAPEHLPAEALPEIRVLRSPDSKITAMVIAFATQLEIVFETRAAELAGAIVHLWRQGDEADVLEPVAELLLQPAEEQAWRASWTGPAHSREQHFAFTVVPSQNREGGPS